LLSIRSGSAARAALINFLSTCTARARPTPRWPAFLDSQCARRHHPRPKFEATVSLASATTCSRPTARACTNPPSREILQVDHCRSSLRGLHAVLFAGEAGAADSHRGSFAFTIRQVELVESPRRRLRFRLEALTQTRKRCFSCWAALPRDRAVAPATVGCGSANTYDIEVWAAGPERLPRRVLARISSDFQARRMNLHFKTGRGQKPIRPYFEWLGPLLAAPCSWRSLKLIQQCRRQDHHSQALRGPLCVRTDG